jgi:hypothetical protein
MQLFRSEIHQGRYAQAVTIDTNNVAIHDKVNACIQAEVIPSEESYLPAFLPGWPKFSQTFDEFRSLNSEAISISFLN